MSEEPKKELPALVASSADPAKISLTIKGAIVWVPAFIMLLSVFGINATPEDLAEGINQLAVIVGASVSVYGIGRKIILKYTSK